MEGLILVRARTTMRQLEAKAMREEHQEYSPSRGKEQ